MQNDVLDHDNSVVNYQAHGGSQPAQRHQIEALANDLQNNECEQDSDGNHHPSNDRSSPIVQEDHQNDRGEHDSQQNRIAHAFDGFTHNDGLVVERLDLNSRRQGPADFLHFLMRFVGNLKRVAVWLAIDVE